MADFDLLQKMDDLDNIVLKCYMSDVKTVTGFKGDTIQEFWEFTRGHSKSDFKSWTDQLKPYEISKKRDKNINKLLE